MSEQANNLDSKLYPETTWCRTYDGNSYTFEEFLDLTKSFHGYPAPGLIIGGKMVDIALQQLPKGILFDAICETMKCLPDAIQLLTPCTAGNGWLKVIHLGRFALTLYDKYEGSGVRVFVDSEKIESWEEINTWFFKLKPKPEQNSPLLREQIRQAGENLFSIQQVKIRLPYLKKQSSGEHRVCPLCGEAYPSKHGMICRGCQGDAPYFNPNSDEEQNALSSPPLTVVPLEQAEGRRVLHDMTQIIPGKSKGPAFRKGQVITGADLCKLQRIGKHHVYIEEDKNISSDWVHENDAAMAFGEKMAGNSVATTLPREGKISFRAEIEGLLKIDEERLEMFNLVPGVMCATRKSYSMLAQGRDLAATRAIPLFLPKSDFQKAMRILEDGPLFQILPLRKANVGILVTGTEIFRGLVKDSFIPIIQAKVEMLGSDVAKTMIVPDDKEAISSGIRELMDAGADMIITTAGLSVDPDDMTRQGLRNAGATDMLYGAPILPGAMTLLARIGKVRLIGVPACALYFKTTSLDLFLPRILAGLDITRKDLAQMGHGAFCLECKVCTFPKCPFGK